MRLLHLAWPHLPLRLERAAQPNTPELVVIGGKPWDAGTVLDCSPAARRQGIRPGMPLGRAHPLAPEALFLVPDLAMYAAAAEAALDALGVFAPFVEGSTEPADPAFGRFLLGIEGLDRLWGDEPTLLRRISAVLAPVLPGPPRAGIGGSRFAAQVAAVVAHDRVPGTDVAWHAVPPGGEAIEAAFLAPLPVMLLPTEPAVLDRLRLFGLRRIGDLARLPRSAVVARFGDEGGFLHDLAGGRDGRPILPRHPPEHLRAGAELDPPVELLEPLRFVLHRLADLLCTQLGARGLGATQARLELALEPDVGTALGPMAGGRRSAAGDPGIAAAVAPFVVEQPLPGPTATPGPIERLLVSRLESTPPPRAVTGMALELDGMRTAAGLQLGLFVPQTAREGRLDWQLADLAIRFGADRILRAYLPDPDARLPEQRIAWAPAAAPASGPALPPGQSARPGPGGHSRAHRRGTPVDPPGPAAPGASSRGSAAPVNPSRAPAAPGASSRGSAAPAASLQALEQWRTRNLPSGFAPGRGRG